MTSHTRELVTIQCGHFANFVGSHWWNLQQSSFCYDPKASAEVNCINHDVLFREGKTLLGEFTFTPRLIALDLNTNMGSLKREGTLYELPDKKFTAPWQHEIVVEESEKVEQNEFLKDLASEGQVENVEADKASGDMMENEEDTSVKMDLDVRVKKYNLDDSVTVWSDFLAVHYHPKSMCLLNDNNRDENFCDAFTMGRVLADSSTNLYDEIETTMHFFTEECDHLQGFQIMFDPYDRFSGVCDQIMETLCDDFGSKSIFCVGTSPSVFSDDSPSASAYRLLSSVVSYASISERSSMFLPLSCATMPLSTGVVESPYMNYKSDLNYHTSAILAALLDTSTLPVRAKSMPMHLADLSSSLNFGSRNIASIVATLPLPISAENPFLDYLMGLETLPWRSFSYVPQRTNKDANIQQVVVRGIHGSLLRKDSYGNDLPHLLKNCETSADLMNLYLCESLPSTRSHVRGFQPKLNTSDPFPHIFDNKIDENGQISGLERPTDNGVKNVSMLTSLQSHPKSGEQLKALVDETKKMNVKRFPAFFNDKFELDEFGECVEKVLTMMENYEYSDDESDSDNDDA